MHFGLDGRCIEISKRCQIRTFKINNYRTILMTPKRQKTTLVFEKPNETPNYTFCRKNPSHPSIFLEIRD
jgi:hypothetical protein